MLAQPETKPVYIRQPLEGFLKSVESAYESNFGRERRNCSPEEFTLYSLPTTLLEPGTVNCLAAPPRLSTPLLLKLLLDHADNNKEAASLFVSHIPPEELLIRMTAYYSRIGINRLRRGQLGVADWPHLIRISSQIYESNIFFAQGGWHSVRDLIVNHSERAQPFGLILINDFFGTIKEQDIHNKGLIEKLVKLRVLAEEYKIAIVVSCDFVEPFREEPLPIFKEILELYMTLLPCAGKHELTIEKRMRGEIGKIPLMLIPEIGVMEDE